MEVVQNEELQFTKSQMPLIMWLCGVMRLKQTLYLHFHKIYNNQTWYSGDLACLAPFYKVKCTFDYRVT